MLAFQKKYQIDMQKSYSYGDTNGDFSMFELVGNPVAINPTKELLLNIKQNETVRKKIRIIVERKDVIYNLNADVDIF